MGQGTDGAVERFHPTSGRVSGWFGMGVAAVVVVLGVLGSDGSAGDVSQSIAAGGLVLAVLTWASLLRPQVSVADGVLVLRNMLETVHVPLAAIVRLELRQVLVVRTAERRYISPALGRSRRETHLGPRRSRTDPDQPRPVTEDYPRYVQERLDQLVDDARREVRGAPAPAVRREPAWLEIGLLAASLVVLVVTLLA